MPKAQALQVTLPRELAEMVQKKIASGAYESASEVVRAGLRALQAQDAAVEAWLRTEGVARYDAYHGGAGNGRPAAEAFARLRAQHGARSGKPRG